MTPGISYANVNSVSIKTQIKKLEHYDVADRTQFERHGAIFLTGLIVLGMLELAHDANRFRARAEAFITPTFTSHPIDPAEKNETVRMPIKFDDGLRAPATTGE